MSKISIFATVLLILVNVSACKNGTSDAPHKQKTVKQEIEGVSVWNRISAREQPARSSARASLLSLGERFLYLDSSAIDSSYNNTKFLKVRLSDSSEVWVYDFASVLNAKPAVILSEVPLYLRPDLLTISDTRLKAMDIVAVVETWDEWIKVVNEKKENTGWIKKEFLSYNTVDLAFALLVKRAMEEEDAEQRISNLEELLDNNPYPGSVFVSELQSLINQEKETFRELNFFKDREEQSRQNRRR